MHSTSGFCYPEAWSSWNLQVVSLHLIVDLSVRFIRILFQAARGAKRLVCTYQGRLYGKGYLVPDIRYQCQQNRDLKEIKKIGSRCTEVSAKRTLSQIRIKKPTNPA